MAGTECTLMVTYFIAASLFLHACHGRRYRLCSDGCCVHEYCAYSRICYPRIHCGLGCPDGHCVGREQEDAVPDNNNKLNEAADGVIAERYAYTDGPANIQQHGNTDSRHVGDGNERAFVNEDNSNIGDDGLYPFPARTEKSSGICMPLPPCHDGDPCGMGHTCSFNYNLGYPVCQYNLAMGDTLCYDSHGFPALKRFS